MRFMTYAIVLASLCGCQKDKDDDDDSSNSDKNVGGSQENSSDLSITGNFGDSLGLVAADSIVRAFAVNEGEIRIGGVEEEGGSRGRTLHVDGEIEADGSFALDIDASESKYWVVSVIDNSAADGTPQEKLAAISFVGMEGELLSLPLGKAEGEIGFGDIGSKGDDGVAAGDTTMSDNAEAFNQSEDTLSEVANTDDPLRSAKNKFANSNPETGIYYSTKPFFTFEGNSLDAVGSFLEPTDLTYAGFGIYFSTNDADNFTFADICAASTESNFKLVEIIPPADVVFGEGADAVTYNASNPMGNAGNTGPEQSGGGNVQCGIGTFYASASSSSEVAGFNVGGNGFSSQMPSGIWTVKVNGTVVAAFDLATASPFNVEGKPVVYLPSIKLNDDGTGHLGSFTVKWNTYDAGSDSYVQLTNIETFESITSNRSMGGCTDYSTSPRTESGDGTESESGGVYTSTGFSNFLMPTTNADGINPACNSAGVGYTLYGSSYRIDLRPRN